MREAGWEIRSGLDADGLDSVFYSTGTDGYQDIYIRVAAKLYDRQTHGDIQFPDEDGYTKFVNFFAYHHFNQDGTLTDGGASSEVGRYGPVLYMSDGRTGSTGEVEEYNMFTGAGINYDTVNQVVKDPTTSNIVFAAGTDGLIVANSDFSGFTTTVLPSSVSALCVDTANNSGSDYALVGSSSGIHIYDIDGTPSLAGTVTGSHQYIKIGTFTDTSGLHRFWAIDASNVYYGDWDSPAVASITGTLSIGTGTIVDAHRVGYGLMLAVNDRGTTAPFEGSLQLVFLGGSSTIEKVGHVILAGTQPDDGEALNVTESYISYNRDSGENGYVNFTLIDNSTEESDYAYDTIVDKASTPVYMYTVGQAKSIASPATTEGWLIEKREIDTGKRVVKKTSLRDTDISIGGGQANAVAEDPTNSYIYIVGTNATTETGVDHWYWYIEKRSTSTLDLASGWGDGSGYIKTNDGTTAAHGANDIAIEEDISENYLYIVGVDDNGYGQIEKRLASDGSLDTSFGGSGIVSTTRGEIYAIAIDSTSMYIVSAGYGTQEWYLDKRDLSDGSLDGTFNGGGAFASFLIESSGLPTDIAVDGTSIYIVGWVTGPDWHIQKRSISTGAVDGAFGGGDGKITVSGTNTAQSLYLTGTKLYVVGDSGSSTWRIERRATSSGSLDTTFNSPNGYIESGAGSAYSIDYRDSTLYVVGQGEMSGVTGWRYEKRDTDGDLERGYNNFGEGTGVIRGLEVSIESTTTRDQPIQQINYSNSVLTILDGYGINIGGTHYNTPETGTGQDQKIWGFFTGFMYFHGMDGLSRIYYDSSDPSSRALNGQGRGRVLLEDLAEQDGIVNMVSGQYIYHKISGSNYVRYFDMAQRPPAQGSISSSSDMFNTGATGFRASAFTRLSELEPTIWALKAGTYAGWNTCNVLQNTSVTGSGTVDYYATPPWGNVSAGNGWVLQGMRRTGRKLLYVSRGQYTKSIAYYDIDADAWTSMPDMPAAVWSYSQAVFVTKEATGYTYDRIYAKADYNPDYNKFFSIALDDNGDPVGTWDEHADYVMTDSSGSFLFYGGGSSLFYIAMGTKELYEWVFPTNVDDQGNWTLVSGAFLNKTATAGDPTFTFVDHLMSKVGVDEQQITQYWVFVDADRVMVVTKTLESDYNGEYEYAYAGLLETYHDNFVTTTDANAFAGDLSIVVNDIDAFRVGTTYKITSVAAIAYDGSLTRPGSGTRVVSGINGENRVMGNTASITVNSVTQSTSTIGLTAKLGHDFPSGSKISLELQPVGVSLKGLDRIQTVNGPIKENTSGLSSDPVYQIYDIQQPQQDIALSAARDSGFRLWPVQVASEQINDSDGTQVTTADTRANLIGVYFASSDLETEQQVQIGTDRYIIFNLEGSKMSRVAIGPTE